MSEPDVSEFVCTVCQGEHDQRIVPPKPRSGDWLCFACGWTGTPGIDLVNHDAMVKIVDSTQSSTGVPGEWSTERGHAAGPAES